MKNDKNINSSSKAYDDELEDMPKKFDPYVFLPKELMPKFVEYMMKIDDDFVMFFPNAESIFNWAYFEIVVEDFMKMNEKYDGKSFAANFTPVITRWLLKREDLPDFLRKELEPKLSKDEPIYNPNWAKLGYNFKFVEKTKEPGGDDEKEDDEIDYNLPRPNRYHVRIPFSMSCGSGYRWDYCPHTKRFDTYQNMHPNSLSIYNQDGDNTRAFFKSLDEAFAYVRSHGFPIGTEIIITNVYFKGKEVYHLRITK